MEKLERVLLDRGPTRSDCIIAMVCSADIGKRGGCKGSGGRLAPLLSRPNDRWRRTRSPPLAAAGSLMMGRDEAMAEMGQREG
jgi:hypothetical protein